MFDTPESALAEVKRLGLPEPFAAVWSGELAKDAKWPAYLRRWHRPSENYFAMCHALVSYVPGLAGLCPLLEENGEAIIGRLPDGRFVRFYYEDGGLEDPDGAIANLGNNYQQFVTTIMDGIAAAGLWDEYGEAVAGALGYKHTSELQAFHQTCNDEDGPERFLKFRDTLT
jgi:hypothetical protein